MDVKNSTTPYGNISYVDGGSGKALLFLHGAFSTPTAYHELLKKLSENFHVIAPVLPGHGRSFSIPKEWGIVRLKRACLEFIKGVSIDPYTIIGHSFGGTLALMMASDFPDARIIAIDAPIHAIRITEKNSLIFAVKNEVKMFMETKPTVKDLKKVLSASSSFVSTLVCHPEDMQYFYAHGPVFNVEKYIRTICNPVDLLWGSEDSVVPPDEGVHMKQQIPQAALHTFEGKGHLYPMLLPEFTAQQIMTLL